VRPAVFLDRDGVINRNVVRGTVTHPPDRVEDFELLPGVVEAARRLVEAGFVLVVVTNQPDVARGKQKREVVEQMNEVVRSALPVLDVLACYHDNAADCACRKPKPGMLLEAAQRWGLDLGHSFLVGDRWSDILAGQAAGCRTVLIDNPYSGADRCCPDYTTASLLAAVDWIVTYPVEGDP
jgi:D-glycero-D-manno-heptose 1,7-bisphosphate phosphatase